MILTPRATELLPRVIGWLVGVLLLLCTATGCQYNTAAPAPAQATAAPTPAPPPEQNVAIEPTPAPAPRSASVVWTTDRPASPTPPATRQASDPAPRFILPATYPAKAQATPSEADTPTPAPAPATRQAPKPPVEQAAPTRAEPKPPLPMFYVFGEVAKPGPYKHTGRNRVLDMIAQVQPTERANPARVLLVRPGRDAEQREVLTIDVDRMIRQGDLSQNHVIGAGDILYVPPVGLDGVGRALQQALQPAPDAPIYTP